MKQISILSLGLSLTLATTAYGARNTLKLGSDSKTITNKARSIEKEYSRDMRNQSAASDDGHQGALVIDEGAGSAPMVGREASAGSSDLSIEDIQEVPGAGNTFYSTSPQVSSFSYPSTLKMREDRRAGVGMMVGGASGLVGAMLELNFEDADGAIAAFGTGPGYNSIQLGWKHAFDGIYLAPYTTVSYSRWYNSRGRTTDYSDSNILDRVLTDNEKKEGKFGTDFVNGSLGLQYNQLSGDFAGVSVFGELTAMYEVKRAMLLPTGSIGALYYF